MLGDTLTDIELAKLEARINREYRKAYREIKDKAEKYAKSFKARDAIMRERLDAGDITKDYYNAWKINNIGRGKRWEKLRNNMAKRYTDAASVASSYVNDTTPSIYSLNHNASCYEIEERIKRSKINEYSDIGGAFDIVDEQTVKRLMIGKDPILPTYNVDIPKAQRWNMEHLNSALLQGILQGDSMDKIAHRFAEVAAMDARSSIRNARTAVTGAQNAGRQASYEQAVDLGIETKKRWNDANDSRVRSSHQHLNGVTVDVNEKFPNGCMFPADPEGKPAEVYNCRCTLTPIFPGINDEVNATENTVESYNAWLKDKQENGMIKTSMNDADQGRYTRTLSATDLFKTKRNDNEIIARRVEYSPHEMYVSNNVQLKDGEIRSIERQVSKAQNLVKIPKKQKPKIVVLSQKELGRNAMAVYNPHTNTIYVPKEIANRKKVVDMQKRFGFVKPTNSNSTMVHEFVHAKDHAEWQKDNVGKEESEYIKYMNEKSKKKLSSLQKKGYNIDVSEYAAESILNDNYTEAYTEYRTKVLLERSKK